MKTMIAEGHKPLDGAAKGARRWTLMDKLLLGLTPGEYLSQAVRNPVNWILAVIFAVGFTVIAGR
ncbi:MAG TPA: hypothetical protein VK997_08915, partial [Deferrisomatales bacterium]|nr:hypothetical protein [Deferrisomatales bacterium]